MLEFRLNSINIKPAMTYSRAGRTTIGPRCLSAVFGMGTGVSTWAWSPAMSKPPLTRRLVIQSRIFNNKVMRVLSLFVSIADHIPTQTSRAGEGMVRPSVRLLVPVR